MDINILSVSFVGVFNTPLSMIPQLDSNFCKNIFHNPDMTISGYGPTGFMVKHKILPVPSILINPAKVIITANNLDDIYAYVRSISEQLPKMRFGAYGLNSEMEWRSDTNADEWLSSHFIKNNKRIGVSFNKCSHLNLTFDISEKELLNIGFEPRIGVSKGVFASVNHHNEYSMVGFPSQDTLKREFERSFLIVNKQISKLVEDE